MLIHALLQSLFCPYQLGEVQRLVEWMERSWPAPADAVFFVELALGLHSVSWPTWDARQTKSFDFMLNKIVFYGYLFLTYYK